MVATVVFRKTKDGVHYYTDGDIVVVSPLNERTIMAVPWDRLGCTNEFKDLVERFQRDNIFGDYQCG
jgi:hypothetical protein